MSIAMILPGGAAAGTPSAIFAPTESSVFFEDLLISQPFSGQENLLPAVNDSGIAFDAGFLLQGPDAAAGQQASALPDLALADIASDSRQGPAGDQAELIGASESGDGSSTGPAAFQTPEGEGASTFAATEAPAFSAQPGAARSAMATAGPATGAGQKPVAIPPRSLPAANAGVSTIEQNISTIPGTRPSSTALLYPAVSATIVSATTDDPTSPQAIDLPAGAATNFTIPTGLERSPAQPQPLGARPSGPTAPAQITRETPSSVNLSLIEAEFGPVIAYLAPHDATSLSEIKAIAEKLMAEYSVPFGRLAYKTNLVSLVPAMKGST